MAKSASAAGGFMQQVTQIRAKLEGADSAAAAAPRERATAGPPLAPLYKILN